MSAAVYSGTSANRGSTDTSSRFLPRDSTWFSPELLSVIGVNLSGSSQKVGLEELDAVSSIVQKLVSQGQLDAVSSVVQKLGQLCVCVCVDYCHVVLVRGQCLRKLGRPSQLVIHL